MGALNENTTYYYVAFMEVYVDGEYKEVYGAVKSFKTLSTSTAATLNKDWMEAPESPASLNGKYLVTTRAEMNGKDTRNYSILYDPSRYASLWTAYVLCSDHRGSGSGGTWVNNPAIPASKQTSCYKAYPSVDGVTYDRGHQIPNADRQQIDNYNGERRYNGLLNAWFEYEFNQPTAISAYALGLTATANRDSRPCCWELMASNDQQQWVTLDVQHYAPNMFIDSYEQRYTLGATGAHIDYADVADRLLQFCEQQLERNQNNTGIYWICDWAVDASKRNEDWGGYWWAAHAVDNYVDNYRRTGKTERLTKLTKMVNGAKARNGNTLINHFYDDMEWMALALLRACDLSASVKRQYWSQVVTLFDDIIGGWSDVDGGGLHWNKNKTGDGRYKTSCSNGPAMILAARLYQQTGEERYLEWAQRIYEYMYTHNRFPDGVIKDHATLEDHEVTFSYNQGTWVGGLLELYKITGEEHYRTTATDLLDLLLFGKWYSPKGIMNERQNYNQDDGGMFKGIFVRYLTQWLLSGRLDSSTANASTAIPNGCWNRPVPPNCRPSTRRGSSSTPTGPTSTIWTTTSTTPHASRRV